MALHASIFGNNISMILVDEALYFPLETVPKNPRLLYFQGIFRVTKMLIKKASNRKISLNVSYPQIYAWNFCSFIAQ